MPVATEVGRLARKRIRPWFLESDDSEGNMKVIYDILSWIFTTLLTNYLVIPFLVRRDKYHMIINGYPIHIVLIA